MEKGGDQNRREDMVFHSLSPERFGELGRSLCLCQTDVQQTFGVHPRQNPAGREVAIPDRQGGERDRFRNGRVGKAGCDFMCHIFFSVMSNLMKSDCFSHFM